MNSKDGLKELVIIFLAALILAVTVSFKDTSILYVTFISFLIIIVVNVLAKKITGYIFEINVKTTFWKVYQFGFRKSSHFKFPLPMAWLPLFIALFSRGTLWWLAILEFDIDAKPERVSRRHGLYRFSEVTEWHVGLIATWGIIANLAIASIGYLIGFESFAKFGIYYAFWSMVPFSSLDGTKIFFASKALWATLFAIAVIFLSWGLII